MIKRLIKTDRILCSVSRPFVNFDEDMETCENFEWTLDFLRVYKKIIEKQQIMG